MEQKKNINVFNLTSTFKKVSSLKDTLKMISKEKNLSKIWKLLIQKDWHEKVAGTEVRKTKDKVKEFESTDTTCSTPEFCL